MSSPNFKAKRFTRSGIIILNAPLEEVFPLFGPIREKEWAHGWNPGIIHGAADDVEEHMVFKTVSRFHEEPEYIWTVSKYMPDQAYIEYTVFSGERIWFVAVKCCANPASRTTRAEITYTYTGLTEAGNAIGEKALQVMFARDLKDWEEAINYYLKTGEKLEHH
jgi:hypothetical protein